ncbi:LOG family protein [Lacticaseibacillus nasuensis]|uniref:LOG family protein n=1 Tax=Lacticaseibacillus nasuensis TaxID=944671 RepID=UPI0034E1ABD3
MTHIAVFCGAASGTDQRFTQAATTLGQWLATHHHTLVYGGGRFGLMGTVATACLAAGARSSASCPKTYSHAAWPYPASSSPSRRTWPRASNRCWR